MNLQLEFTPDTAVKIAEYFEKSGYVEDANSLWLAIHGAAAYDCNLRAEVRRIHFRLARKTVRTRDALAVSFYSAFDVDLLPDPKVGRRVFRQPAQNVARSAEARPAGQCGPGAWHGPLRIDDALSRVCLRARPVRDAREPTSHLLGADRRPGAFPSRPLAHVWRITSRWCSMRRIGGSTSVLAF